MYEIKYNEAEHILEVRYSGFWEVETAHSFVAAWRKVMEPLRARFAAVPMLSDSRELAIQSPPVLEVMSAFTADEMTKPRAGCAILVKSALSSLQAKRVAATDPLVKVFTDEAEARAWLRQDGAQVRAAAAG